MSRIKKWLGSDSSFEDAETNGNDWRQIKADQPVPEGVRLVKRGRLTIKWRLAVDSHNYYITNYEQMVCNGHWPNYKTIEVNYNEH